ESALRSSGYAVSICCNSRNSRSYSASLSASVSSTYYSCDARLRISRNCSARADGEPVPLLACFACRSVFRDMLIEFAAVESHHAVSTSFLRDVQCVVSGLDERLLVRDERMRPCRDATAHRPVQRLSIVVGELVLLHAFPNAFRECYCRVEHGAREQQHKFLSPIPADPVYLSRLFHEQARELLQHHVAGLVSIVVVHTLEVI